MERGFIKLWRKFQDNALWKESRVFSKAEAWLDLIMEVQHTAEPQQVLLGSKVIICHRGESVKSLKTWSRRWKWDKSKVRRFLKLLKECSMIDYKNETITTRITLLNYNIYTEARHGNETIVTHLRHTCDTLATPDKNERMKEENNMYVARDPETPLSSVESYAMRFTADGQKLMEEARSIMAYLNKAAKKNLPDNYFGMKFIIERLAEGKLPEQFREIIDKKVKDPSFNRNWLRPETLFTQKNFDKYLQETEAEYGKNNGNRGPKKTGFHKDERKTFPVDVEFG